MATNAHGHQKLAPIVPATMRSQKKLKKRADGGSPKKSTVVYGFFGLLRHAIGTKLREAAKIRLGE
jgi:hypothetical protein